MLHAHEIRDLPEDEHRSVAESPEGTRLSRVPEHRGRSRRKFSAQNSAVESDVNQERSHPAEDGEERALAFDGQRIESSDLRKRVIRCLCQHPPPQSSPDEGSKGGVADLRPPGVCRFAVLLATEGWA